MQSTVEMTESVYYDTLVLSGGSTKGLVTLGAIQYCYDNFMLNKLSNYVGTSSGCAISYLLIIGYTPVEIITYICTHQLLEKMQHFNLVAMLQGRGVMSFNHIQEQLEKMTIDKIGYLPTLQDLHSKYEKTLVCVTHNLTSRKTEYISHITNPAMPCLTAIRMSCNLPLIFENYKYGDSFYIDGGISDNFPISVGDEMGKKVLGLVIVPEKQVDAVRRDNVMEFIYDLLFIPIEQAIEYKITNASDKCRVIRLQCGNFNYFDFDISSTQKLEMFSTGYTHMSMCMK